MCDVHSTMLLRENQCTIFHHFAVRDLFIYFFQFPFALQLAKFNIFLVSWIPFN